MSVIPHKTKHKTIPGEVWWYIRTGRGKNERYIPFEGDFAEAKKLETSMQATDDKPIATVTPIKDMVPDFLKWYKNEVAASTLEDINDTINLYMVPILGKHRPAQLTAKVFNDFKDELVQDMKPVTVNKHLNYISSFLKWVKKNVDGCRDMSINIERFTKKKTKAKKKVPLTRRQVDAIYKHIPDEYKMIFLLMSDHGLRISEACDVAIEDIDEENENFNVVGKGNKDRLVPFMSDRFVDLLDKTLEEKVEGPLSINPKTGEAYVTIWKPLVKAAKDAGITRPINHHLLRHTFATQCAMKGMNPHALQKILGHASIETTNKIYTNVGIDFVGDEGRRMRGMRQ